jgi:hypothetical protein
MSYAYQALILTAVAMTHSWSAYFWAAVFPLTILYHNAALLNFSSLHLWLKPKVAGISSKENMCHLTAGRFLGAPFPGSATSGNRALATARWAASMLLIHLPSRIAVLSGDLPVHDYHHRHPRCSTWADYIYTRQWDIDAGTPGWETPYTENWGLITAIGAVFTGLSLLDKNDALEIKDSNTESSTLMIQI